MLGQASQFRAQQNDWLIFFELKQQSLYVSLQNQKQGACYEGEMTTTIINDSKNFSFFFENVSDLFKYLCKSFKQITITEEGQIIFYMEVNLVRSKIIEFTIPTIKRVLNKDIINEMRIKNLQIALESVKQQNSELTQKLNNNQLIIQKLNQQVSELRSNLNQKDDVINSIFSDLNEINKWREEFQKNGKIEQKSQLLKKLPQFVPDQLNPHNNKFTNSGQRYFKTIGGTWDVLMNKIEIDRNFITRFEIKQIRAGNNGSFMYGIATTNIKGLKRPQDSKQFIGYYENTGCIYDRGESKKGGVRIKDGNTVSILIDTINWRIAWSIQNKRQAQIIISEELRTKHLYLAIIAFNQESQIMFL